MKILFLDCDGTIREPLSGAKFISHPRDQRIIPGADKAIQHFHRQGYTIIGVSNQGGVGAGHKSLKDTELEQRYTLELFPEILAIYFCPDFEGQECWWVPRTGESERVLRSWEDSYRKPGSGMVDQAMEAYLGYRFDKPRPPMHHWLVGDRPEDQQCAIAAGINFLWAEIWRSRFLPGIHEHTVTPAQVEFSEGVKINN